MLFRASVVVNIPFQDCCGCESYENIFVIVAMVTKVPIKTLTRAAMIATIPFAGLLWL